METPESPNKPKKSIHQERVDALEAMRRTASPAPTPRLTPFSSSQRSTLSHEDLQFNRAIDRQIEFWKLEAEKADELQGHARDSFAVAKEKGRAQDGFNRASGFEQGR